MFAGAIRHQTGGLSETVWRGTQGLGAARMVNGMISMIDTIPTRSRNIQDTRAIGITSRTLGMASGRRVGLLTQPATSRGKAITPTATSSLQGRSSTRARPSQPTSHIPSVATRTSTRASLPCDLILARGAGTRGLRLWEPGRQWRLLGVRLLRRTRRMTTGVGVVMTAGGAAVKETGDVVAMVIAGAVEREMEVAVGTEMEGVAEKVTGAVVAMEMGGVAGREMVDAVVKGMGAAVGIPTKTTAAGVLLCKPWPGESSTKAGCLCHPIRWCSAAAGLRMQVFPSINITRVNATAR